VVIDLETTGHSPENNDKIIDIGMVMIEGDKIVDTKASLINPQQTIPSFITKLTAITDEAVQGAPHFIDKADYILEHFQDSYLIAHNVPFDLGFLNAELKNNGKPTLKNPVIDTVELARILFPASPSYKLSQLAAYLNIEHDEPHRALSDAYVTAEIFLLLKEKLNQLPYETLAHLATLEPKLDSNLQEILQAAMDKVSFTFEEDDTLHTYQGLAFRMQDLPEEKEEPFPLSFGDYMDSIYEDKGALERHFKKYEKRPEQREMSEAIFDAFQSKNHALIEAETGTGKSLAYLLPAVYEAYQEKQRIVISTYTTQLQTQLLDEEIPLIKKIVPFPFQAVVLKGRNHYISLERFYHELNKMERDTYDITLTKAKLLVWITETETGDIDEIRLPASGYAFYNRISAGAEGKLDVGSPWFRYSYYIQARQRATRSDLVITNHALLCTDMFHDYQYLPSYHFLIVDEAHHLESTAGHHYGLRVDYTSLIYTLNQIGRSDEDKLCNRLKMKYGSLLSGFSFDRWDEALDQTKYEIDVFFQYLHSFVSSERRKNKTLSDIGRIQFRFNQERIDPANWDEMTEMVRRIIYYYRDLIEYLLDIDQILEKEEEYQRQDRHELLFMKDEIEESIEEFDYLFLAEPSMEHVKWIEMDTKGPQQAVFLYSEPIDISQLLNKHLFQKKESVILTSATLTMRNSFRYIKNRIGLSEEEVVTKQFSSPFTFKDQVKVLVPNDFPHIKQDKMDDFIHATSEAILSLAEVTDGRMLVLFTSYDMLRRSYKLLKEIMPENEYMLIGQGITSGSRTRLKKNFQSFERSILLGTSSFWEGVDIPGEDLSCLMIVRLPFQPPNHPVFEAKSQNLKEAGKNPFMDLSLPNAVIKFKQGFGRLIRSTNDRGLVFICDARVVQARYGKYFTESIPDVEVTYDSSVELFNQAKDWF